MHTLEAPSHGRREYQSSELSRNSKDVLDAAESAPVGISRRDGQPLVLMSREEADAKDALLAFAAQLIAASLDEKKGSIGDRLADRFDWMLAFSSDMRDACANAIIDAARASFSTGQAHLAIAEMASWKSTAAAIVAGLGGQSVEWLEEPVKVERPK